MAAQPSLDRWRTP